MMEKIFSQGQERYGSRELSTNIIKRPAAKAQVGLPAPGLPPAMTGDEPDEPGYGVQVKGR